MPDVNAEVCDLNRNSIESIPEYIKRVWNSRILTEPNTCMGMDEMSVETQIKFNTDI